MSESTWIGLVVFCLFTFWLYDQYCKPKKHKPDADNPQNCSGMDKLG